MAFADAWIADEDEVLHLVDPGELGEVEDEGLVELGLERKVEGFEGRSFGKMGLVEAADDAALAAVIELCAEEVLDGFEHGSSTGFVGREEGREELDGALHAEGIEQLADACLDVARHHSCSGASTLANASA